MDKVPSLFIKKALLTDAVEYFDTNEQDLLDLLTSNCSFAVIYEKILWDTGSKDCFVDLITRNLMFLMQGKICRRYLVISSFIYGISYLCTCITPFKIANSTQRESMLQIWQKNNPHVLFRLTWNFDIIEEVYPYASLHERSLLYQLVKRDKHRAVIANIPAARKLSPRMESKLIESPSKRDFLQHIDNLCQKNGGLTNPAFANDFDVIRLFFFSHGKKLGLLVDKVLPQMLELRHDFRRILGYMYFNGIFNIVQNKIIFQTLANSAERIKILSVYNKEVRDLLLKRFCEPPLSEFVHASFQNEIDFIVNNWIFPSFKQFLGHPRSGDILVVILAKAGSKCKTELIECIVGMDIVDDITCHKLWKPIQLIIQKYACSSAELEQLCSWILPHLKLLLNEKEFGLVLVQLFKKGEIPG